jgi:hypothetical protein
VFLAPPDWIRHHGVHLLTMYPPGGGGRIRCYERIRPLQRLSQILGFVLERDPAFRKTGLRDVTTLQTSEGEHGAWVRVNGTRDEVPVARFVGAVFADDFVAALDTLVVLPAKAALLEATARELLFGVSLKLGIRRRRYLYQPPAGWRGLPSGLTTHWYPPDYPGNATSIVVAPAEPSTEEVAAICDSFVAGALGRGHTLDGAVEETEIVTAAGLRGRRCSFAVRSTARGERSHRELAAFAAPPYVYSLRMESGSARRDEQRAIFTAVAQTVTPVPAPGERKNFPHPAPAAEPFAYLLD